MCGFRLKSKGDCAGWVYGFITFLKIFCLSKKMHLYCKLRKNAEFSFRCNICFLLEVQATFFFWLINSSVIRPLYKINNKNKVMIYQYSGMYSIKLVLARQTYLINWYENIKCKVLRHNTQIDMSVLYSCCLSCTKAWWWIN